MNTNELEGAFYQLFAGDSEILSLVADQPDEVVDGGGPGIFEGMAPQAAIHPFIVFFESGGTSEEMHGGRWGSRMVYTFKASAKAEDTDAVNRLRDRMDAILTSSRLDTASQRLGSGFRISPLAYTEEADGVFYKHRGGRYSFLVIE